MGAEVAGSITWPEVATDYHGALVRLTTMRAAKKQYLIFGYVELFPRDIPVPGFFAPADRPWTVPGSGGDVTLAASAIPMQVSDALAWYEHAAQGRVTIPRGDTPLDLAAPAYGVEPTLGRFCVGETVPFAASWHGIPRIHRLVQMEEPDTAVQSLQSAAEARDWLSTNAGFDPFPSGEWIGSISLLAPDPLLSGVGHFTEGPNADGSERVVLQAHRRRYPGYPGADADALKLIRLQRRPAGWVEVFPTSFDHDGFAIADYPEPVSESGYAIYCPKRGLLRLTPPGSWIGQVKVVLGAVDAVVDVEVPVGGRRKPASTYRTARVAHALAVQVGESIPPSGAIRIIELRDAQKQRVNLESAPQHLFGAQALDKQVLPAGELATMRAEAETIVANLITEAQHRVIFVDPDFGLRELQNYALRVIRDGVEVKVLTSARRMRETSRTGDDASGASGTHGDRTCPNRRGVQLLAQLQHVRSTLGKGAPEVFVMPGSNKPLFHDRFLVIDDVAWASGPSFNELGERIGLISRVHEPRPVIAAIERVLGKAQTLADWIQRPTLDDAQADEPESTDT